MKFAFVPGKTVRRRRKARFHEDHGGSMKISDVMTPDVEVVNAHDTLRTAAELMADLDSSALPVGENNLLIGAITDHDIVSKIVAPGRDPWVPVSEVMTTPGKPSSCLQRLSSRNASGPPSGLACAEPMKRPG